MTARGSSEGLAAGLLRALEPARDVLILPHDNPDPDALASALAVRAIVRTRLGRDASIARGGMIGRSENRALVELLRIPLTPVAECLPGFAGSIVLVDTQPGRRNNSLGSARPAAVIDHHPDWGQNRGVPFVDLRSDYGATSTILTEYLQALEIPLDARLATALFYGVSSETRHLAREAGSEDIHASQFLYPYVDKRLLGRIENPSWPRDYFGLLAHVLERALVCDDVVVALLERVPYPDAVSEIADLLVRLEDAEWAICLAPLRGALYVSLRSTDPEARAGLLLADALPPGCAGGHGMVAGGRVPLDGADPGVRATAICVRLLRELGRSAARAEPLNRDGRVAPELAKWIEELARAAEAAPPEEER